jgi:KDO2-lipid IV(A) lauroyltransferase
MMLKERIKKLYRSPLSHGLMQATSPIGAAALDRVADAYEYLDADETARLKYNFSLAFPHLSDTQLRELVIKHRRATFQSEYERKQLDMMPGAQLRDFCMKRVEIGGTEHLRAACESPEPVVLFTPHYGSFAIGTMRAAMDIAPHKQFSLFYDSPEKNPTTHIYKGMVERLDVGTRVLYNDRTAILAGTRALRKGDVLGIMPDVYEFNPGLMYVPFFGGLTVAMGGTAFFALKAKARLLPAYCVRSGRGRFLLRYDAPIELSSTGNLGEDIYHTTVRIFANMQAQFTAAPEHWVYWDKFSDRTGHELEVRLPCGDESWAGRFTKLRRALATEKSTLGRFLGGFEVRLHQQNLSQDEPLRQRRTGTS